MAGDTGAERSGASAPPARKAEHHANRHDRHGLCRPGVRRLLLRVRPRRRLRRQGQAKIDSLRAGKIPIFEPGLDKLVADNARRRPARLHDRPQAGGEGGADAVFIAVGTPTRRGDGHADLSYVYAAAEEIAGALDRLHGGRHQVDGAGRHRPRGGAHHPRGPADRRVRRRLQSRIPARGSAIDDFMRPDRVVIGVESRRAREVMRAVYRPLYLIETPMVVHRHRDGGAHQSMPPTPSSRPRSPSSTRSPTSARRSAPTSTTWPAASASTAASAASSCMPARLRRLLLSQGHAGAGDDRAARPRRRRPSSRRSSRSTRRARRRWPTEVIALCGGSVAGKTIGVLGLTFKPNTDDMRDSARASTSCPALQRPAPRSRLRSRGHGGGAQADARTSPSPRTPMTA